LRRGQRLRPDRRFLPGSMSNSGFHAESREWGNEGRERGEKTESKIKSRESTLAADC
jgi:hypothetical protein